MGVAAGDHVHTQIAQLLGNGRLIIADFGGELVTPEDEQNDGVGAVGLHGGNLAFHFRIELAQLVIVEGIDQTGRGAVGGQIVDGHVAVFVNIGEGIAGHAHLDAIDIFDHVAGFRAVFHSTEGIKAIILEGAEGALQAGGAVVVAVLIAGQQQVKTDALGAEGKLIGAIKVGETGVFLAVCAGKGGFQIGYRIVRGSKIGLHIGENVIKDITISHGAGADDGQMQHHIAGNGEVCPGDLHPLAGIDIDRLGLNFQILQRNDGGFLAGEVYQMITIGKQTETEVDGTAANEKEHQQTQRKSKETDRDIHAPGDFKFILFFFFHGCAPQVSSR